MKLAIVLTAAMAMGGVGVTWAQVDDNVIPAARVRAALQDVRESSPMPTTQPATPQANTDEVVRLRGQINGLRKENTDLKAQLQREKSDRVQLQSQIQLAMQTAQQAYYMAQRGAGSSYPYAYPAYTDSFAYPGGPIFTVPAQGATPPNFTPPSPAPNAADIRFLPNNFAGFNPAPPTIAPPRPAVVTPPGRGR